MMHSLSLSTLFSAVERDDGNMRMNITADLLFFKVLPLRVAVCSSHDEYPTFAAADRTLHRVASLAGLPASGYGQGRLAGVFCLPYLLRRLYRLASKDGHRNENGTSG